MTDANTIALLLPELSLVVLAVWIYVGGVGAPGRRAWTLFAVVSLAIAAVALWRQSTIVAEPFQSGPLAVDSLAYTFRWVAIGVGLLFVLVASRAGGRELSGETIGTLLLITVALMLVASAGELVFLFLALELISIPTYVLLFLGRPDRGSAEATVKYFLLSILSSGLFLYGLSFLYGMTGSTRLDEIAGALAGANSGGAAAGLTNMGPLALVLIFAGLAFKITAVPLHFYAPDVYQGTTNANAGLLAVAPKIAGIVALVRVVAVAMPGLEQLGWHLTLIVAMATMTLGNVCALWQNNIRRLLAYSSIAHAGYMLIGLAVALGTIAGGGAGDEGLAAMLFYLLVYVLATFGTFAALAHLGTSRRELSDVDELAGLGRTRPVLAGAIAAMMFSLTGIPPLAGFWGKWMLFLSTLRWAGQTESRTVSSWFIALAIVAALNAAIGAAYYLRIVAVMYFRQGPATAPGRGGLGPLVAAMACAALVLVLGLWPGGLMDKARDAGDVGQAVRSSAGLTPASIVGRRSEKRTRSVRNGRRNTLAIRSANSRRPPHKAHPCQHTL